MMLESMKDYFNETKTTNGAKAYKSTKSHVLDLFYKGGAMRNASESDIQHLVSQAYNENSLLTMKTLFYLRDIKQGQGERNFFKVAIKYIANNCKEGMRNNIALIGEYGYWKDVLVLLDTELKNETLLVIANQLMLDSKSGHPSLLAKWLPSENASSQETKRLARIIRQGLNVTPKQYRKLLSGLRSKINLVETKLTEKRYADIDYTSIPSKAGMVYRKAFYRNDEERYTDFLNALSNGKVKVNSSTLYPSDIVEKILGNSWYYSQPVTEQERKLYQGQWENLPNFITDNEDSIVMADTSGSMSGTPMNVAISLAMYIAERNKGAFNGYFMTFNDTPQFIEVTGKDVVEKAKNIKKAPWGGSTNIESALNSILDVALTAKIPQSEMIKKIYIVSDMQFNYCTYYDDTVFHAMKRKYAEHGYELPQIVFWNVNGSANVPVTTNDQGVALVSGYSPSIMKNLLGNKDLSPYGLMLQVIESERYQDIVVG